MNKKVNVYAIPGVPQSLNSIVAYINAEMPEQIVNRVAEKWGIPADEITGLSRKGDTPIARHVVMYLIRNKLGYNATETGEIMGWKHYSTVLHSCKVVKELWETDKKFRKKMIELI